MSVKQSPKWVLSVIIFVSLFLFHGCQQSNPTSDGDAITPLCPVTDLIPESDYHRILYISDDGEDSAENGSKESPFESIEFALQQITNASADNRFAIMISQGGYSDETIILKDYVDMYGGFKEESWERNIQKYQTVLDGDEKRRILIAANHTKIDGFFFTDGLIRGQGAAIFCDGSSPQITNNTFYGNKTLGPKNWNPKYWHETAHDGGAIYGQNGSSAKIKNNLFINNTTQNGRGGAISFDGRCKPEIIKNVFLSNTAGLDDPMRSSDGGAVNIFDWSDALIEGNAFVGNKSDLKNDGGAVFIAFWSSARINNNVFVDNHAGDDAGALFVGGQEHRYDAPLDPLPPKDKFYVSIKNNTFVGNHHDGFNSGAMRFTMESRGDFIENKVAHNSGIYFQRSEIQIARNVILDNFLLIETKEGLGGRKVENNLLWAKYDQQVEADVHNNNMLHVVGDNYHEPPEFVNDGMEIASISTNYYRQEFSTIITIPGGKIKENSLVNRVIRANGKWSVVKSNTTNTISIWGEHAGVVHFTIMPTYTLLK